MSSPVSGTSLPKDTKGKLKQLSSPFLPPAPILFQLWLTLNPQEHADVQSNLPKEKKRLSPVRLKAGRGSQASLCIFRDCDVSRVGYGRAWIGGPRATRVEWLNAKKKKCTDVLQRHIQHYWSFISISLIWPACLWLLKRERECVKEREKKGDGVNFVVGGFQKAGGRA